MMAKTKVLSTEELVLSYGGCTEEDVADSFAEFSPTAAISLSTALRLIDARIRSLTRRIEQLEWEQGR